MNITTQLTPITPQQAFDAALFGIRKQGYQRAVVEYQDTISCVLRGKGGLKCAIGHSLPDELFDPTLNRTTLTGLIFEVPAIERFYSGCNTHFLRRLQYAHDSGLKQREIALRVETFEFQMEILARSYQLDYTPPDCEATQL